MFGYRLAVFVIGAVIGLALPALILGPFVIQDLSLSQASTHEIALAAVFLCLGAWLIILSFLAEGSVIDVVIGTFQTDEALLLLLPYLIYAMSRSVFRRVFARR